MRKRRPITNWIEVLKNRSEKEEELVALIDAENDRFESSPEYQKHRKKMERLYKELDDARSARIREFKKEHPVRSSIEKTENHKEIVARREANKKRHEEWISSLPQNVKDAFAIVKNMTPEERNKYQKLTRVEIPYDGLDNYENPVTTEDDIDLLQHILVQTIIEFIKERNLTDIWSVGFGVDGLQATVEYGAYDSSIEIEGIQDGVRKIIGHQI